MKVAQYENTDYEPFLPPTRASLLPMSRFILIRLIFTLLCLNAVFLLHLLLEGLSSNAPSYPSFPIKEQLQNVLESKEIELDALLKLLGVELKASHQLKTVHDLVNNYEEQNGQISLETWESIFRGLGYSKDFLQVLANFNEKRHCQGKKSALV